jgi:hypothetical protein
MIEAKDVCEQAKNVLQYICASDEIKKNLIIQLVNAIVKLEKNQFSVLEAKRKLEFLNIGYF